MTEVEHSTHVALRALIAEVWPQITRLTPEQVEAIPAPVMHLIATVWGAGALGTLPHEQLLADARERAAFAEAVAESQRRVLNRLAELADPLHFAAGAKPRLSYNRHGVAVRDYGVDLDRVCIALAQPHAPPNRYWCIEWTEHERGWGSRPDGHSFHLTRDAADAYARDHDAKLPARVNGVAPDEYTSPGKPFEVEAVLKPEAVAQLAGTGVVWGHPSGWFKGKRL